MAQHENCGLLFQGMRTYGKRRNESFLGCNAPQINMGYKIVLVSLENQNHYDCAWEKLKLNSACHTETVDNVKGLTTYY